MSRPTDNDLDLSRADHREERERRRIKRTAAHLRELGGDRVSQSEAEREVREARERGRRKRGES